MSEPIIVFDEDGALNALKRLVTGVIESVLNAIIVWR